MDINIILSFLKDLFLLKYLPKLGNNTGYGLLFIFGILTSFHCIGMCGGIAISQSIRKKETKADELKNKSKVFILPSLLYNLGRVISYTIVGGFVGGLGRVISFTGAWKAVVPIVGGVFMIIMAVNLLGIFPALRRFNLRMPSFVAKKIYKGNNNYSPMIIGLLSGLMPCGPLQIVQLYALGTGSVIFGATSMFVFAIGTVPILLTFGVINTILSKKFSNIVLKASAVLVFILGIVMIGRGLVLTGITMDMPQIVSKGETTLAVVEGKNQNVTTEIEADSYPTIVVVKGLPVKWVIKVKEENLNECNNAIQIPKFKIEKGLNVGDNLVEFTPEETGEFAYTCWMGMIKSKITVVDSLNNITSNKIQESNNSDNKLKTNDRNISSEIKNERMQCVAMDEPVATTQSSANSKTESTNEMIMDLSKCEMMDKARNESDMIPAVNPSTTIADTTTEKVQTIPETKEQSFTGYIIDEDCFVMMPQDPGSDTKVCLRMSSCTASGYGIAVLQSDGSYKFYFFDGEFAPKAAGAQVKAFNIISNTTKKDHVSITVKGTLTGDTRTSQSGNAVSYPVIKVSSITEN
jgi:sulfite exporter TauE/SafE